MATRLEKREVILVTAEAIFLRQGLLYTAMDQIADEAGMSRRTLYRYFDKKENLAYEVTTRLLTQWNIFFNECYKTLEGRGLEKLEQFLNYLLQYMSDKVEVMNYLGEFDFYFKDSALQKPSELQKSHFDDIKLESDDYFKALLKIGIEDGSVDKEVNVELTEATISNVLWSFGQRVASRGQIIYEETGFKAFELVQHQVNLYIRALSS